MTRLAAHIDACLAALGTDGFAPAFCDYAEGLGVDQVMIFSIGADRAGCLLSRHFSHGALGGRLAEAYLSGWWRQDPLLPELMATPEGAVQLRRFDAAAAAVEAEYRRIFFDAPGLSGKTTLLAAGARDTGGLRLFVNLYRAEGPAPGDAEALLAGRLALLHFQQAQAGGPPAPLAVLSARERDVCLGILAGRKAEAIAGDLGVAASTVVTYRKRAYEKLGVTSRAGLFAICQA
ncbi:helix-turn-helix transcriptional regulator [Rhodovulum sp. DZ06]|uniref:helix-turn-helix transcriptional regulator n=1 Tax=Rhodovulum sp. DZ06 TaxID=3425126 RepID=UPI003D336ED6